MDLKELIESYGKLHDQIEKIIDYNGFDGEIVPMLNTNWRLDDGLLNYDRLEEGDMEEWSELIISSYSSSGEKFYTGQKEGFMFIMAYDDDCGWDSAQVFIFSMSNEILIFS